MFKSDYMEIAFSEAEKAFTADEVPVGAVIVNSRDGKVIAAAHNQVEQKLDPTAHAEILAIRKACAELKNSRLVDCDIYVTLEPCAMCAQAISHARVRRLYYAAYDEKSGGVDHGARVFSSSACHHKPEIYSGIAEEKGKILLQEFFQAKRLGS